MLKVEFSASLLQSSVSHDPSEITLICWFAAQNIFLINYQCWKRFIFYGTHAVFFRILWWINVQKNSMSLKQKSFVTYMSLLGSMCLTVVSVWIVMEVCDVSHLSVFTPVALHGHWRLTQLVFHIGNFCWGEADQVEMIWITEHYLWN